MEHQRSTTTPTSDAGLITASRRGEHAAFGQLVARYQALVGAVSYARTCDRVLADDVTQETFLVAWRQLDQLRDPERLSAWLCAIARNLARQAQRKRAREVPLALEDQAADSTPFDDLSAAQSERMVRGALARVPETCREAMVLYYREQLPAKEVAAALGISEAAAMQRLSRGRQQLATVIAQVERSLRGSPRRNVVSAVLAALPLLQAARANAAGGRPRAATMALVVVAVLVGVCATLVSFWGGSTSVAVSQRAGGEAIERDAAARNPPAPVAPGEGGGAPMMRVAGRVIFDGRPVVGAIVSVKSGDGRDARTRTITTGEDGRFDYGSLAATHVIIGAGAPGKVGAVLRLDLRDPRGERPEDLVLELYACEADLHGFILDAGGGSVSGAVIRRGPIEIAAADDGAYALCVPIGTADVEVAAEGYGTIGASLAVTNRLRRDFRISPEGVVTGRVVRSDDDRPVADAVVVVESTGAEQGDADAIGGAGASAVTDAEGRFRIEGLVPGRRELGARAAGLRARAVDVNVMAGEGEDIAVTLEPTTTVRGRVVDESGAAVVGARVTFYDRDRTGLMFMKPVRVAVSEAEGGFVADGILPGIYAVGTDPYPSAERVRIDVPAAGMFDLTIPVRRGSTVSGVVLRGGKPVAGATVRAEETPTTRSGPDGQFELVGVQPGPHQLYAESEQLGAFSRGPTVAVPTGNDVSGVTIDLALAGSIAGVVVDQNGQPVSGAFLSFSLVDGHDFGESTSSDDGSFKARAMSGGGDYAVTIMASRNSSVRFQPAGGDDFPAIRVADGNTHVEGVRYAVIIDRKAISGTVVDEHGVPRPDVRVEAAARGTDLTQRGEILFDMTNAEGVFVLSDLPAGDYNLVARSGDGAEARAAAPVAAGARHVALVLAAPGVIEGTLEGFPTPPHVTARRTDASILDRELKATAVGKTFRIRGVAPGTYTVTAVYRGAAGDRQNVEVPSGAIASVILTNRGTGSIDLRVADSAGVPIPRASCLYFDEAFMTDLVRIDDNGRGTISGAPVGPVTLFCSREDPKTLGRALVQVVADQTVEASIAMAPHPDLTPRGTIGAIFERASGVLRVASLVEGGPADAAGIKARDVVLGFVIEWAHRFEIPFNDLDGEGIELQIGRMPPGTPLALTLRRGTEILVAKVAVAAR